MKYTLCDQCLERITKDSLSGAVKVGINVFCCTKCRDFWVENETKQLDESDLNDYDDDEENEEDE